MFLIAIIAFISSCCPSSDVPKAIIIGEKPARHIVRPYHIEYNGHKYIYFSGYEGGSMVHDPDCCKEETSIW